MPFHGDTTGVLFLSIVQDTPVPPTQLNPGLPAELQLVINKCLEKDRELRYQEASHILFDLKRLGRASSWHTSGATGAIEEATVTAETKAGIAAAASTSKEHEQATAACRRFATSFLEIVGAALCRRVCLLVGGLRLLEIAQDSSAHREGQHRAVRISPTRLAMPSSMVRFGRASRYNLDNRPF